ncbi:ABC transporter permease [Salisaeta longa]|uniref:ABC transporter permease n=1 Tax=Salisaeta longa TaxID=503170 RepID=UPI0003B5E516|nr:iron export ABC transporter permease subunit FetB [Salisaeta longa]
MTDAYISIGYAQLALSAVLMLVNIGLSVWLRLGLGRKLLVASLRMTVQLLLVGLVLEWLFETRSPALLLGIALLMAGLASVAAVNRTERRFPGIYWNSLVSIVGASFVVTGVGLLGVVQAQPWFDPQYAIPLLGMVLGNALTGISLGLDRLMEGCVQQRGVLETLLGLGATRWEAGHRIVKDAMRTALIPVVNSMMVMGIVSLPGMMTGQILAGAAPADAVRYQVVIMFMIAACTALASLGAVLLGFRVLFSRRHALRLDRLREAEDNNWLAG